MNTGKVNELKRTIHMSLIELCSIADEEDMILDLDICTEYINRAGNIGANGVINCDIKMIDKGEL